LKRISAFLIILGAGVVLFLITIAWYLEGYQSSNASVAGMMGQMMGNQVAYGMTTPMPWYLWSVFAVLIVVIVGGIGGVAYYATYPEIRTIAAPPEAPRVVPAEPTQPPVDWSVLLRTSNPEEKKVLHVIASHGGKYLQKFIVKEAGLSKLKTHRIVSRFAERGIVTVARSGNTNEVSLAPWLKPETVAGESPPK
jgi:hypothetical protein